MSFQISPSQFVQMLKLLEKKPADVLLSPTCRAFLALDRWVQAGKPNNVFQSAGAGVMPGTVNHNMRDGGNMTDSATRTIRLLNPLSALDPVFSHAARLKVLTIGPRTEMELLHLMAIGFHQKNISALDMVSPSPLITPGDMHDLPYPDHAFHVVISSWVIAYSNRPQRVMDEMLRVCKNGALLAIGATHEPDVQTGDTDIVGSTYRHVDDFTRLMGSKLDRVLFQQEPDSDDHKGPVMLIGRVRHS
jgi:hypothetical protein